MSAVAPPLSKHGEIEKYSTHYKCGGHVIQQGLADELLAFMYQRFRQEETLDLLFYESKLSMFEFIARYLDKKANTLGCFYENPETLQLELRGFGWINQITPMGGGHQRASIGEAFFRGTDANPLLFAQMMIEWAFDNLGVSVLHGVTPVKNRAAAIFPRKIGFTMVGPLPGGTTWQGELCDVWLSALTKERWHEIRPWRA